MLTDSKPLCRFDGPPLQKIPRAAHSIGLSQFYLRQGIKAGTVPFIKSGNAFLINVPKLLESLDALPADRG